jgi:hypothetical protein
VDSLGVEELGVTSPPGIDKVKATWLEAPGEVEGSPGAGLVFAAKSSRVRALSVTVPVQIAAPPS